MPLLLLSNWKWIVIALLLAACGVQTVRLSNLKLAVAEQKIEASNMLVGALRRAVEAERKLAASNVELEKSHAGKKDEINAAVAAALGGVRRDPGGRCRPNAVSVSADPGVPSITTAGCELSQRASDDLTKLAGRADLTAEYARACREWALTLPSLLQAP